MFKALVVGRPISGSSVFGHWYAEALAEAGWQVDFYSHADASVEK